MLAATITIIGGALIAGAAHVAASSTTGADTSSALHQIAAVPADAAELVAWKPDAWGRERTLEPGTRALVAAAYIRAWAALGRYQTDGNTDELFDTFSGEARTAAEGIAHTGPTATWDVKHTLQLTFYALDGATIAFTDGGASILRTEGTGPGETVIMAHENYQAVMVLEDGYWRIRQLRRGSASGLETVAASSAGATLTTGVAAHALVTLHDFTATEYRPNSWSRHATNSMLRDLRQAKRLGLTALRVPLPLAQFGEPAKDTEALHQLATLLNIAQQVGIGIEPVLLDGLADLSPASWVQANAEATAVVQAAHQSPALIAWDLADRPDVRTAGAATSTEIRALFVQLSETVRNLDAVTPLTISWSTTTDAIDPAMASLVDAVTVHLTGTATVANAINQLRTLAPTRPAIIVVTGLTTDGGWQPEPRTETSQAYDIAAVLLAADRAALTGVSVQTLRDTVAQPASGLLRANQSLKPAAHLFSPEAQLAGVSAPTTIDYLTTKFALAAAAALAALVIFVLVAARRQRRRQAERIRRRNDRIGRLTDVQPAQGPLSRRRQSAHRAPPRQ